MDLDVSRSENRRGKDSTVGDLAIGPQRTALADRSALSADVRPGLQGLGSSGEGGVGGGGGGGGRVDARDRPGGAESQTTRRGIFRHRD